MIFICIIIFFVFYVKPAVAMCPPDYLNDSNVLSQWIRLREILPAVSTGVCFHRLVRSTADFQRTSVPLLFTNVNKE